MPARDVKGRISANEAYSKDELVKAMGFGRVAFDSVRDAGAVPLDIGGRHVYFGDELIQAMKTIRNGQIKRARNDSAELNS